MLNKNPLSKLLFLGVFLFNCNIVNSESLNECIKKAVLNKIELNKILTICRENINPINVYSNDYAIDNSETKSDFIFTNTMDSVINEFIEKGDLLLYNFTHLTFRSL